MSDSRHYAMITLVYAFRQNSAPEVPRIRSWAATTEARWLPQPAATAPGKWSANKG